CAVGTLHVAQRLAVARALDGRVLARNAEQVRIIGGQVNPRRVFTGITAPDGDLFDILMQKGSAVADDHQRKVAASQLACKNGALMRGDFKRFSRQRWCDACSQEWDEWRVTVRAESRVGCVVLPTGGAEIHGIIFRHGLVAFAFDYNIKLVKSSEQISVLEWA